MQKKLSAMNNDDKMIMGQGNLNNSMNFAQKELTQQVMRLFYPKNGITSPKNNANEDPQGEIDTVFEQKLNSFCDDFRK